MRTVWCDAGGSATNYALSAWICRDTMGVDAENRAPMCISCSIWVWFNFTVIMFCIVNRRAGPDDEAVKQQRRRPTHHRSSIMHRARHYIVVNSRVSTSRCDGVLELRRHEYAACATCLRVMRSALLLACQQSWAQPPMRWQTHCCLRGGARSRARTGCGKHLKCNQKQAERDHHQHHPPEQKRLCPTRNEMIHVHMPNVRMCGAEWVPLPACKRNTLNI